MMILLVVVNNRGMVYRWTVPGYSGGNANGCMTLEALKRQLEPEFGTFRKVIKE